MTSGPSKKNRFIIFAYARSGSTTLHHLLYLHPEIKMAFEPFNQGLSREGKGYHFHVKDNTSLNQVLDKIYVHHTGIKHLNNQLSEEHNKLLLKKNYKIIFLWRKNYLQKTISHLISTKTGVWFNDRKKIFQTPFSPVKAEDVLTYLNIYKSRLNNYYTYLTSNRIDFYNLTYEELYHHDLPVRDRLNKLNEVFNYLGYSKLTDRHAIQQAESLLDPGKSKINDNLTYNKIPNIMEIHNKLSCEENGYLFPPGYKRPHHHRLKALWINLFSWLKLR